MGRWPLAAFVLCALVLVCVTWQVAAGGPLLRADVRAAGVLRTSAMPDGPAELLADLGNVPVALSVLAVAAGYAAWRARRARIARWWAGPAAAALLLLVTLLLVVAMKALIGRPGPPGPVGGTGFYPSGHAATSAAAYGAAVLLLLPWTRGRTARRGLVTGCLLVVVGTGYGLVRRGYHWPLDVLGSWSLCGALLVLVALCVPGSGGRTGRRDTDGPPDPPVG
ncbi:hypothetical protein AB852_29535 [Streptomyces uncialis]|uniref:Phosphatidic acid phosphatase type 2/haloperoxidase domain-containing protein n=1 Tax=Streptomyces uncialis TaxID=1048205 RepID=A0A1Q4V1Q6_9ACTN|nr:hypothetical protein AB852_29535 [Streptomyces uncialis]